ncbi:TonB-dependent receptor [Roseateles chitinivorans]|uniref:TonB-dependent receptor n=1 Tax=Roseateles chitinivorans TaxID=2917965 RepID=UPI003D66E686
MSVRPDSSLLLTPLSSALKSLLGAGLAVGAAGALAQAAQAPEAPAKAASAASTSATSATSANTALNKVTVQGKAERQKAGLGSRGGVGILGSQDAMDIPFSTLNYTEQLMRDQQSRTLADVLQNDASVRVMTAAQGFGEDFQIRGFAVPSGDVGFNGLFGLASANRMPAEVMERVEVLKGPNAMVNGMPPGGSVGGSINVIPKRAADLNLTRVTTSFSSGDQLGVAVDVGRRFGEKKEWGVRFNGSYRDGEASIDDGNARQRFAALALDFRGTQLRWTTDVFKQHENIRGFRSQPAFVTGLTRLPKTPDPRKNIYGPDAALAIDDEMFATKLEYDVNDRVTVWAGAGWRDSWSMQDFPTASTRADANGDFRLIGAWYDAYFKTKSADAGARARFETAGIGHSVSVGISRLEQETGFFYLANPTTTSVPSNIYNPVPMPAVIGVRGTPTKSSDTRLSGVAIADTLSFLNERLLVTLGLRDQTAELTAYPKTATNYYNKSNLSRLGGVVFKATEDLSVYANYAEGLTRGAIAPTNATIVNPGEALPPFVSKQIEAGVKKDWGSFLTSLSVYQIKKANSINVPVPGTALFRFAADGEQRNRGVELSAQGEIIRSVRWLASASYTDAKQQRTAGGAFDGKDATGVADKTASIGADWDVPYLPGLGINGRVIYTSSGWIDNANTLAVPAWTRADIGARYTTRIAGVPTVLRANIDNVFDRHYWLLSGSYATVATGRTVVLSASFDF